MSKKEDKHRHHKQPQFYLKGFAAKSSNPYQKTPDIWIYKKGEPYIAGKNPSLESVKDAGYSEDFYAFEEEDGATNFNKYEDLLMKEFEQPANPVIEKIRNSLDKKDFYELSRDEKAIMSKYIASMITRGDWWRNVGEKALTETSDSVYQKYSEILPEKQDEIQKTVRDFNDSQKNGGKNHQDMIERAEKLASIFQLMNWKFFISPKDISYLTSDNPVYYFHLDRKESEVIFPISSKVTISLSWQILISAKYWRQLSRDYWEVNDKTVELCRQLICSSAIKEIYYSQKREWLVKFINNRT